MVYIVIHQQRSAKGSKEHSSLPLTLQASLHLPNYMAQVAEQLAWQPGKKSFLFFWASFKTSSLGVTWARVAHLNEKYAASKIQRGSLHCASFLVLGGARCTMYSSQKGYLNISYTTGSLECHRGKRPHNFCQIYFPLSDT